MCPGWARSKTGKPSSEEPRTKRTREVSGKVAPHGEPAYCASTLRARLLQASTAAAIHQLQQKAQAARSLGLLVNHDRRATYPLFSSRIAFFTFVGTWEYFNGSMALAARPVLIERSSVV